MSAPPIGGTAPGGAELDAARQAREVRRMREAAVQLEGMFVRQLFAAMRETVPQDGPTHGGPGEEMFTAMLHEHVADALPARWDRGIAAQVAAQVSAQLRAADPANTRQDVTP